MEQIPTKLTDKAHDQSNLNPYATHTQLRNGLPSFSGVVHAAMSLDPTGRFHSRIQAGSVQPISYIEMLPPEVLGEIFIACLPNADGWMSMPSQDLAPMLLCMVCSYWRRVALSTPMLWRSVSAGYRRVVRPDFASLLALWVERSRQCPLSLSLNPAGNRAGRTVDRVPALFFSNVYRCKSMNVRLAGCIFEEFVGIPKGNAPLLETLDLNIYECTAEQAGQLPRVVNSFTNLRRLNVRCITFASFLDISWSRLTHIILDVEGGISLHECVEIFSLCSQAVDCNFGKINAASRFNFHTNTLLPALVTLELVMYEDVGAFLNYFTCPSLKTLLVHQTAPLHHRDLPSFDAFLTRSACRLERLTLDDRSILEDDLIGYLGMKHLRCLKELDVCSARIFGRTLDFLKYPDADDESGFVLPFLETLGLQFCYSPDGAFATMLASRCNRAFVFQTGESVARLKSVRVGLWHLDARGDPAISSPENWLALKQLHEQDFIRLKEFQHHGLHIIYHQFEW